MIRNEKRGEKDSRLAESIDDYLFLDSYTAMYEMDGKDSTIRQNLPVLGKFHRYIDDVLFYFSLVFSKGLFLTKSSLDKLSESIESSKRKCSSSLSLRL